MDVHPVPVLAATNAHPADLALAGEIALLLGRPGFAALDAACERLRVVTGADVSELFFAHPDGSQVFLVSHQGSDVEAFGQKERFRIGEGFPGIVLQRGTAIWTNALGDEPDFVRTRVRGRGYEAGLCVPLLEVRRVTGCLVLAWKTPLSDLEERVRTATLCSHVFAIAVALFRGRALGVTASHNPEDLASDLQAEIPGAHVDVLGIPAAGVNGHPSRCEGGCGEELRVLGGRVGWPRSCVEAGCTTKARYCIPIRAGHDRAVASIGFPDTPPAPLTKYLPAVLWMTQVLDRSEPTPRLARPGLAGDRTERLVIRCLGDLEVVLEGARLLPGTFRRSKARELLALLVAAERRWLGIPGIIEALWPGAPEEAGRNRFHVTLFALRQALQEGPGTGARHIQRQGEKYRLDPRSSIHVDLWHLRDLLRRASAARGQARPPGEMTALLRDAFLIHRGDLFAGEFHEGWASPFQRSLDGELRKARLVLDPHAGEKPGA